MFFEGIKKKKNALNIFFQKRVKMTKSDILHFYHEGNMKIDGVKISKLGFSNKT